MPVYGPPSASISTKVSRTSLALNLRGDFGAVGDGTTDDSAAIKAAEAALVTGGTLTIPKGSYRFAQASPSGQAAILISGKSNVGIYFEPGAEILMDNLSSGAGTSHGISVKGAGSNIVIDGARIRWATQPSSRSTGSGFNFLGYPSDGTITDGWVGGKLQNVQLLNCTAVSAPQTGAIFMGCSDVRVVNFRAESTMGDALHFNACRRVNVSGHTAVSAGDDGLAFVTYYDPTNVWSNAAGPFSQSSVGAWSNTNSSATGIVVNGGAADGLRISGSKNVTVTGLNVSNKTSCGVIIDSAIVGAGVSWTYQASLGCKVSDVLIDTCGTGLYVVAQHIDSSSSSAFWKFDVTLENFTIRGCTNWSVRTEGDGTVNSILAGFKISDIRITSGSGGGGNGAANFLSLRDSSIANVWMETANNAQIGFYGQDASLTGALSTLPVHNLFLDNIHTTGSQILFQDLRGVATGRLRSKDSNASGVVFVRCSDFSIQTVRVRNFNRSNTGTTRGIMFQKVAGLNVAEAYVNTDSNNAGTYRSLEVGGGDATDPAANGLRVEKFIYENTLNQSGHDIVTQGGGFGPVNYLYRATYYNGGEASPIWRTLHAGATATSVERFIGSGAPAVTAAPGSLYLDSGGGGVYYKASGNSTTGWLAVPTTGPNVTTTDPTVSSDGTAGFTVGQEWVNTSTGVLFVCISTATGAAVWQRQTANIQTFTANGTWTKPAWVQAVTVVCLGSGGGGGSGAQQVSGAACSGGAGGGGAGYSQKTIAAALCGATETIAIASAGTGAAAQASTTTAGVAGGNGGTSSFGNHVKASGGNGGGGGQLAAASVGGTTGTGLVSGGTGAVGANGGVGAGAAATSGAPAGAAGGGISTTPAAFAGGAGSGSNQSLGGTSGTAGTLGGGNGGNGSAAPANEPFPGYSGGGGGSSITAAGGPGGNAGNYGAGGGGGGASLNGFSSGAGGNGGAGIIVVISQ